MENIEIHLYFISTIIILCFLLPFILWLFNILDKSKLAKINTFEEFKEKMKIMVMRKWLNPNVTLTNEEIRKEVLKELEKKGELFKKRSRWLLLPLYLIFVCFFIHLSGAILRYYITVKTGYEFPLKFPTGEVLALVALSIWISAYLFSKLGISRINMILKKLRELEDKTS